LAQNAIKYSDKGKTIIKVSVEEGYDRIIQWVKANKDKLADLYR